MLFVLHRTGSTTPARTYAAPLTIELVPGEIQNRDNTQVAQYRGNRSCGMHEMFRERTLNHGLVWGGAARSTPLFAMNPVETLSATARERV